MAIQEVKGYLELKAMWFTLETAAIIAIEQVLGQVSSIFPSHECWGEAMWSSDISQKILINTAMAAHLHSYHSKCFLFYKILGF